MLQKYINGREIYYIALLFIFIIPWAIFQISIRIPSDVAFLFSGATMLLEGKAMSEYFYDNNPPMSFLIYTPSVFLYLLGTTKHMAIQIYVMAFTLISIISTYYFLSKWERLKTTPKFIFLSCYICAITLISYIEYGQKDHLIEIALVPFLLMQMSITKKHKVPTYVYYIIAIIYVPFILIKPHYGLLPTCMIIHRLYITKNLYTLLSVDFIALAIGTISYVTFIFIVTPDFITEILPSSMLYYIMWGSPASNVYNSSLGALILTAMIAIISGLNDNKGEAKTIAFTFSIMAMLSIIPFFTQGKGFSLHLFPTICLIFIATGMTAYLYIKDKNIKLSSSPTIFILFIFSLSYLYPAFGRPVISANKYQKLSFAKLIKEKAGSEPFFIETYSTNIIATTAFYTGNKFASRFPTLWFITGINNLPEEKKQGAWDKFSALLIEDFKRYKPKLIAFQKPDKYDHGLLSMLRRNKEFADIFFNHYEYKSEYELSKSEYINFYSRHTPDKIIYDIYIRND